VTIRLPRHLFSAQNEGLGQEATQESEQGIEQAAEEGVVQGPPFSDQEESEGEEDLYYDSLEEVSNSSTGSDTDEVVNSPVKFTHTGRATAKRDRYQAGDQ